MQPADIALTLRRRSAWEAADLGIAMMQRWWRPVYAAHAAVLLCSAAAALLLGWAFDAVWAAIVAIWWLQPVYDRTVLHVLSRAVFGAAPHPLHTLGTARTWLSTGLLKALSLDRLDPARSFNLPVRQLEGSRGREARARRRLLGRRARGSAVWLTVVWVHFEGVLLWSAGALAQLVLPAQLERQRGADAPFFGGFLEWMGAATLADGLVFVGVWLLLEPFYVAAGFALYLNRRTLLEGWDIEVALRRIAERHAAAALLVLALGAGLCFPALAYAQPKDARTEIAEVLKDSQFGHYRDAMVWKPRNQAKLRADADPALGAFGYAFAKALQVLLGAVLAAAAAYLLWRAGMLLPRLAAASPPPYRPPGTLFGVELAPEHLPADVALAAAGLAEQGRLREALALLYRGALAELVHKRGVPLRASHTEGEAVRVAGLPYFERLVEAWRACAYGRRELGAPQVAMLVAQYRETFP